MTDAQWIVSTRPLVDTDAEHQLLERMIDDSKPPPRDPAHARQLHYLLYSPFRYPPLRHGSRFGRRHEPSLWYGSEELRTALAETAYYRIRFFEASKGQLAPHQMPFSAFRARVATRSAVDVSSPAFDSYRARICSPSDYTASQRLGSEMRADRVAVVRYPSARDPRHGHNVGLFTPEAFSSPRPLGTPETWLCTVTRAHDVEFAHQRATTVDTETFPRQVFLVGGRLPIPKA